MLKKFIANLLPSRCLLCSQRCYGEELCVACLKELPILTEICPRCALPFSTIGLPLLCGKCLKTPPPFDNSYVLFAYEGAIPHLVTHLKFHAQLIYAELLGKWLAQKIASSWYAGKTLPDCIIPVPLHPQRLRERGFNQALEIAKPIASTLKLPLLKRGIIRIKYTQPQTILPASKRQQNMRKSFYTVEDYTGRHVAIVDDVMTTGHTLTELSHTLKNAGAKRIDVWCCARSLQHAK